MSEILQTGQIVEFLALPAITKEQLRKYADASGDPNPIHLDDQVAKRAGLPGIIAHGMLTAAFLADRAQKFMAEAAPGFRLTRFQTRFKAMTLLGDVLSLGGTVKEVSAGSVTLELSAKNQKGEITTTAVAVFASA